MRLTRSIRRIIPQTLLVALTFIALFPSARAYPPQDPGLSPAQRERLKERDRLAREADALRRQGKTAEAIRAAESMLAINREVLGRTSTPAINATGLLAQWNRDRRDWKAAARYQREALDSLKQKYGKDDEDVTVARWMLERIEAESRMSDAERRRLEEADEVERQGNALLVRGKFDEAVSRFRRALSILDDLHQGRTDIYSTYLLNLGVGVERQQKLDEALACYRRALAVSEQICGNGHSMLCTDLEYIATVLEKQGRPAEARSHLQRAVKVYRVIYSRGRYPRGHIRLAGDLRRIGTLLLAEEKYPEARPYLEQALAMLHELDPTEKYPQCRQESARALHDLAAVLGNQDPGRYYAEARRHFERALAIRQAIYPGDKYPAGHVELARTLAALGRLLTVGGDPGQARAYIERALEMYQRLYPTDRFPRGHDDLARTLDDLGRVLEDQGHLDDASRCYSRALAMYESLYPEARYPRGHVRILEVLVDLGIFSEKRHQLPEARQYDERALAMARGLYPRGHRDLAKILNNRAHVLAAEGSYDQAEKDYTEALAICRASYPKESYPAGHPELSLALANLGTLALREGEFARAWTLLDQALELREDLNELFVATSSEAEALGYLALSRGMFWRLVSCSMHLDESVDGCYAHVWKGKAMIARVLARRQASLAHRAQSDPAASRALTAWNDRRRELARLLFAPSTDPAARDERIRRLTDEKERLERQLAALIPGFARDAGLALRPHRALIEALPDGMVVLDFARYSRREQDPKVRGDAGRRFTASYAGFVLARGKPVRRVDLGPADAIDRAVLEWRTAIVKGQPSPAAGTLRRLVWEPMARQFPASTGTVVIVPDGLLTAVPWAALPGDRPGAFLIERHALAIAPHAPFVLDLLTSPGGDRAGRGTLLAIGGMPDEGPGAVHELETVIGLARPRPVVELRGQAASLPAVLRALPRARWAHFDTHGFFATPEIQSSLQVDPDALDRLGRKASAPLARNPLLLSGLQLGGRSDRPPGTGATSSDAPDILTAEAIAGLPLQGLDLAVLSACETGLGTVAGGEGVFGLQRAFHLAGTQTVVASLWSVEVGSTRALMAEFYKNLWQRRLPRLESLRQAQLAMIRDYRDRGTGKSSRGVAGRGKADEGAGADQLPPVLWSGFVLSGDWR